MKSDLVLDGFGVCLEPLSERHLAELMQCANDPALWEFTFQPNPFTSTERARAWLAAAVADNVRAFAIIDKTSGAVAGSTRFLDIEDGCRKLEIGWTFLARRFWQSNVNTETKLLLLRYAFEEWNAVRVQFKAEAINERSHRAILRIGARHEGTLRSFRIRDDGEVRDVNVYSIIAPEWPQVRSRLITLLDQTRGTRAAG